MWPLSRTREEHVNRQTQDERKGNLNRTGREGHRLLGTERGFQEPRLTVLTLER